MFLLSQKYIKGWKDYLKAMKSERMKEYFWHNIFLLIIKYTSWQLAIIDKNKKLCTYSKKNREKTKFKSSLIVDCVTQVRLSTKNREK